MSRRRDARDVIDATGLIVAPGFIDVHTHADDLAEQPLAENFVRMGVTTDRRRQLRQLGARRRRGARRDRADRTVDQLRDAHRPQHGAQRGDGIGRPTADAFRELTKMRSLVWRAMADGAVGFSTGLQYVPGTYAKTPEIIDLARVAGNAGGVYATHMRNEGTALEAAVEEVDSRRRRRRARACRSRT